MTLEQFFKEIDEAPVYQDYLVRLKYKYEWEDKYTYDNIVLECGEDFNTWIWSWDWNEGQTDVTVIGYVAIDDIPVG